MKFIFGIIGGYIGALIHSFDGFIFGAGIGFLFGYVIELKKHLRSLEEKVTLIQSNLIDSNVMVDDTTTDGIQLDNVEIEEISITEEAVDPEEVTQINQAYNVIEEAAEPEITSASSTWEPPDVDEPNKQNIVDKIITSTRKFFTTGNVVVKVGVIILFFGVAFLLKYAAQRNAFPIELRLIAVAVGAIGMLIFGWRLRHSKTQYALVLQGGAVGVLYLTVFSAAKLYTVLPLGFTFFVMVALVVFSCLLAVLQNSRSLACLATIGGFLAPVLTSSGGGSHIALFSYYAVLNAGIFGIAWFKAWRVLNWLGFVFTFVIASLWGHDSYHPEYFNTTEPFLILFFLFYVAISVLFAHKQPPHLKGLVDGSLVFGVPLVGFTLQGLLVNDYEFGQAYSALGLSALYIVLARWLWNKQIEGMRLLTESFLALGVIFGSIAIPFALDGNWTAAAWALEGAGISWVGIRQQRLLPRIFGILLQFGGGFIFLVSNTPAYDALPILNSTYMGSFLLSVAGLFSAFLFYKNKAELKRGERYLHWMLLTWALLWWFCSGVIEIDNHLSSRYEVNATLFFVTLSMLTLSLLARVFEWKAAEFPPILLLPAMYFVALVQFIDVPSRNPLSHYGFISWITAFIIQMLILYRSEWVWNKKVLALWHSFSMYLYVFLCTWIIADFVNYLLPDYRLWEDIIWGLIPAFGVMKMMYLRDRVSWPVMDYPQSYVGKGLLPIVFYLGVWIIFACHNPADPKPLPYLPIVNPLELVQLFSIIITLNWLYLIKQEEIPKINSLNLSFAFNLVGLLAFVYITSVVAHAVHFYAGIHFDESAMFRSEVFQASISIVWTLMAFIVMCLGTRRQYRKIWFVGASLLGVVVIKLFLIDLADSGGIARIVSFLTVGALVLVIGYFSPIPPKQKAIT
jgi:uncharacterized membrane protein